MNIDDDDVQMKDTNRSDSSNDDSSEDEDITEKINDLELQLKTSPFLYDSHIEIIKILRAEGELDRLRIARNRMSETFPLTPELWIDWIGDEKKISTENDRNEIYALFDRAVEDYFDVGLWIEYCGYTLSDVASEGGRVKIRATFERAIQSGIGVHCSRGSALWAMYMDFEIGVMSLIQNDMKEQEKQNTRIEQLLRRQIVLPLEGIEKSLSAYEEWTGKSVDSTVRQTYEKALKRSRQLFPLEVALAKADSPRSAEHNAYIANEIKDGNPTRIQLAFERAISDDPLQIELWSRYTQYIDKNLKISSISLKAHDRSVRNCSWSAELWITYCLAIERFEKPHTEILGVYKRAFSVGLSTEEELLPICKAYCSYLRHRIIWHEDHDVEMEELRTAFQWCTDALYVGNISLDTTSSMLRYWAQIEAKYCKNIGKSRELWKMILKENHGSEANMWLEYFTLERSYGKHKNCVKILQDAVNSVNDYPETMFKEYINYCCTEGTFEEYETSLERCGSQQKRVDDRRIKAAEKEVSGHNNKGRPATKYKENKSHHKDAAQKKAPVEFKHPIPVRNKIFKAPPGFKPPPGFVPPIGYVMPESSKVEKMDQSDGTKSELKREIHEDDQQNSGIPLKKKTLVGDINEKLVKMTSDGDLPPTLARSCMPPPPAPPRGVGGATKVGEDGSSQPNDTSMSVAARRDRTVFVSNLDFKVTENLLTSIFAKTGDIGEIRLVTNILGKSKGYAYVEFKQLDSVQPALLRDRETISGRPMFISKCKNTDEDSHDSKEPIFKYSQEMEKNKLFVKGLPFSTTKESLEQLFSPCGEIKDIRMVTQRSGAFKGLAYIDYVNESSASKAVLTLDGKEMGKHSIVVAISNPPVRKEKHAAKVASLGAGRTDVQDRGRSHSQISFTPRSLTKANTKTPSKASTKSKNDELPKQKMSNNDFRNFLFKK